MTTVGGYATVAEKLMELLNLSLPRTDVVPSEEICKRCYRQLNEIDFLEIQVFTFDTIFTITIKTFNIIRKQFNEANFMYPIHSSQLSLSFANFVSFYYRIFCQGLKKLEVKYRSPKTGFKRCCCH